jgi:DNA primase
LDDSIDVLERKLQLLERKGWLGTLSGRRRALDRLLPTIKSASDPVTRDLYVSRAAEALGVSRESVERESRERKRPRTLGSNADQAVRTDDDDAAAVHRRVHLASPERELVRVMLHSPGWRGRIRESLPESVQLVEPEGELIKIIAGVQEQTGAGEILESVEGMARAVVAELLRQGLGEENVDAIVEGALRRLENRALNEQKRAVTRKIAVATEEEKVKLLQEKVALNVESRKLETPDWNVIRRGGKTGAG